MDGTCCIYMGGKRLKLFDQFEITLQTNGKVGGLQAQFQGLENKLDLKSTSVQSGTRRLSEDRDMKGKLSRKPKVRFQRMRAKDVGLSDAEPARKRGNVEVCSALRYFVRLLI